MGAGGIRELSQSVLASESAVKHGLDFLVNAQPKCIRNMHAYDVVGAPWDDRAELPIGVSVMPRLIDVGDVRGHHFGR